MKKKLKYAYTILRKKMIERLLNSFWKVKIRCCLKSMRLIWRFDFNSVTAILLAIHIVSTLHFTKFSSVWNMPFMANCSPLGPKKLVICTRGRRQNYAKPRHVKAWPVLGGGHLKKMWYVIWGKINKKRFCNSDFIV